MKIIINRIRIQDQTTDGQLFIDGQHICDTAEATPKLIPAGTYQISLFKCTRSKRKIPILQLDQTGYYQGNPTPRKCNRCRTIADEHEHNRLSVCDKLAQSLHIQIPYPEVVALEKRLTADVCQRLLHSLQKSHDMANCPKILPGNGVYHRYDGGIIVGRYLQPGVVIQSHPIFDRLYERIEKAISRGHEVQLVISNT